MLLPVVHARDDLVALTPLSPRVLAPQQHDVRDGAEEPDPDVCQHDTMPESVPRPLIRAILQQRPGSAYAGDKWRERRTTFEETAPLMFPKEMTIPRVTDRLYEPSTLFETQAITFGILE